MKSPLRAIADSPPIQFLINLILYAFYAAVLGVSVAPSVGIGLWGFGRFIVSSDPSWPAVIPGVILWSLCLGAAFFLYLMWGSVFQALVIRLLSLGIKPGTYPIVSSVCLRWIIYSGVFTIAVRTILPVTVMSFFCRVFFRIVGCKIGKNVYINSPNLNDAQFLELADNAVIGGYADISCHTFEGERLILGRITIGSGSVIGAHAYIFPNVTIGRRCSIGVNTIVRKNRVIPDGSAIGTPAGLPLRAVARIEREHETARRK